MKQVICKIKNLIFHLPVGRRNLTFLCSLLFCLLEFTMNCKAENYYIVDPTKSLDQNGWKAPGLNEWLKLTPVVGQNGVYTIDLPANYPGNMKYDVKDGYIQNFINAKKDIPGFSFAIASYSQIERCAKLSMTQQGNLAVESNKDKVNAIKAKFLAPSCTGITTSNYQVNKVSESGTLTTYGENSNKKWEIITPLKKSYSPDEFDYSNYYKAGENGYDWGDKTFLQLKDEVLEDGKTLRCLDGTYRLTIDLNNNTWTMEYLNDRRVAYLTTLPLQNKNIYISDYNDQYDQSNCYSDYQAYSTATLTQMKGEGEKFTNIFYNPNVYLKNNTRLLYMSQFKFDDEDVTHYINGYYTSLKNGTQEEKLNKVMSYAYTPSYDDGLLHPYTGSYEGKKIVINDSLTFNCAHLLNKETNGTPTPMKEEGYYTSLHLYPFLKGRGTGGVIVFGDGTQKEDKPLVSDEITLSYYHPENGCNNIGMPYDQNLGLYKRSLGQYNRPAQDIPYCFWTGNDANHGYPDALWVQDKKDPKPTPYCEEDADFLEKVNSQKDTKSGSLTDFKYYNNLGKMIHYYGEQLNWLEDVTIYFKIGVAADGKTPTYKYWLERPITIDVPYCEIGSLGENEQHHGMNIRTFCSNTAYNIAPSDDEYETKIYTVSGFVKTGEESKGKSDNYAIAKATLTEVHHIPANTGVILISKTKNGLNKYNDKDGTVHVRGAEPNNLYVRTL